MLSKLKNNRILYYGLFNNLGGIETYLYSLSTCNGDLQGKIDFLTHSITVRFEEQFISKGSKIYKIPSRSPNPLLFYWSLFKFFRNHKEHKIVHFFLQSASSIAPVIIAKTFGKKVIVDSRSSYEGKNKVTSFMHKINKRILPIFMDGELAISKEASNSMFNKEVQVIKSGIDTEKYLFNESVRTKYRKEMKIQNKFVMGHVGRFAEEKNHNFLIDIFIEIKKKRSDCVLLLIGEGPKMDDVKQKVIENGLLKDVLFLGNRSDVNNLLQAMDVFVFPSLFEGLGRVLLEAQASGLSTFISSNVPSEVIITDLVEQLPRYNTSEWVSKILNYNNNYQRFHLYHKKYQKAFDIKHSVEDLKVLYTKLLN